MTLRPDTAEINQSIESGIRHRLFWQANLPKGQTYVYLIQCDPGTPIKVGFTNRVGARLKALQTGSWMRLRELAAIPAPRSVETAYHHQLDNERVLGEWFEGPNTLDLLGRVLDIADRMMAAFDGSDRCPDVFGFDPSIERPAFGPTRPFPSFTPDLEVIPAGPSVSTPMVDRSVKSRLRAKPEREPALPPDGDRPWNGRLPDWWGGRAKPRHPSERPPPGQTRFT